MQRTFRILIDPFARWRSSTQLARAGHTWPLRTMRDALLRLGIKLFTKRIGASSFTCLLAVPLARAWRFRFFARLLFRSTNSLTLGWWLRRRVSRAVPRSAARETRTRVRPAEALLDLSLLMIGLALGRLRVSIRERTFEGTVPYGHAPGDWPPFDQERIKRGSNQMQASTRTSCAPNSTSKATSYPTDW